jgi:hypothetical protein
MAMNDKMEKMKDVIPDFMIPQFEIVDATHEFNEFDKHNSAHRTGTRTEIKP